MFGYLKALFMPWMLVLSFGGSSKSSSASTSNVSALDKRLAVDSGVGISNDINGAQALDQGIALNITSSNSGKNSWSQGPTINIRSESLDDDVVFAALGTVEKANALAGQSLDDVLMMANNVFSRGADITQRAMEQTGAAYDLLLERKQEADLQESGALDNRTVVLLAVAGLAAVVMLKRGG